MLVIVRRFIVVAGLAGCGSAVTGLPPDDALRTDAAIAADAAADVATPLDVVVRPDVAVRPDVERDVVFREPPFDARRLEAGPIEPRASISCAVDEDCSRALMPSDRTFRNGRLICCSGRCVAATTCDGDDGRPRCGRSDPDCGWERGGRCCRFPWLPTWPWRYACELGQCPRYTPDQ